MSDPVEDLFKSKSFSADDIGVELFTKNYKAFYKRWSGELTKALNKLAKENTKKWFKAAFNRLHTPFKIRFNAKENTLYIWGEPPNANIDKHTMPKRVAWGKSTKISTSDKYQWHNAHFHRVFIKSSDVRGSTRYYAKTGGFWFTAKKKWSNGKNVWFSKTSHSTVRADKRGYTRLKDGRKYPYPAMWTSGGGKEANAFFHRGEIAVSDKVMNSEEFQRILFETFEKVKEKFS